MLITDFKTILIIITVRSKLQLLTRAWDTYYSHIHTVHEGQRDYKCESCGKSFSITNTLKYHPCCSWRQKKKIQNVPVPFVAKYILKKDIWKYIVFLTMSMCKEDQKRILQALLVQEKVVICAKNLCLKRIKT